jgi:F-type H+-transporting ATPase subunit b
MPQLDFSTFPQQLFWLFITFSILYITMAKVILPRIASILSKRAELTQGYRDKAEDMGRETDELRKKYENLLNDVRLKAKSKIDKAKESAYKYHYEKSKEISEEMQKRLDKSISALNVELEKERKEIPDTAEKLAGQIKSTILDNNRLVIMAIENLAVEPFYLTQEFFVGFAFVLFVAAVYKPVYKLVIGKLDGRAKEIEKNLEDSARLKEIAQELLASYEKKYSEFEKESQLIIAEAEKEANRIIDTMEVEVKKEVEKKMLIADEKIRQYQLKAITDINLALSELAVKKAEDMLVQELKDVGKKNNILVNSVAQVKKKLH